MCFLNEYTLIAFKNSIAWILFDRVYIGKCNVVIIHSVSGKLATFITWRVDNILFSLSEDDGMVQGYSERFYILEWENNFLVFFGIELSTLFIH